MKSQLCLFALFAFLALVAGWSKDDYEIFRLRDEVEISEGDAVSFYDFIGVKPSASHEEIQKAFRKRSKALHPDKAKQSFIASQSTPKPRKPGEKRKPGVHVSKGPTQREVEKFHKLAAERYSRLSVVADILKGEGRARYDFFLKNGFPKWRGTGYYYQRFRPGLGSVLFGLFVTMGGAAHYGALVIGWKRQREFVGKYIRNARKSAWGDETGIKGIPGLNGSAQVAMPAAEEPDSMANMNRRQKRQMEKDQRKEKKSGKSGKPTGTETPPQVVTSPTGEKKRILAENGKVLVVDSIGNVFLEEEDEEGNIQAFLLDEDEIPRPTIRDTALVRLPLWLYGKALNPFLKNNSSIKGDHGAADEEIEVSVLDSSQESDPAAGFEIVDSSGIETEALGSAKKRSKQNKK